MKEIHFKVNKVYDPLLDYDQRYLMVYGGRGSGKSVFAAQKLVYRDITERNHKFLVVRSVKRSLKQSCYQQLKQSMQSLGIRYKENKSDMELVSQYGSRYLFEGLDDFEKLKSIQGITSIWIEELASLSQEEFDEVDLLLRGKTPHYKQIIGTWNPPAYKTHWTKARFIDNGIEDGKVVRTTYRDNSQLDDAYRKKLEGLKHENPALYERYCNGEYVATAAQIYNWPVEASKHPAEWYDEIIAGIDYGYNNPSAFVLIGIKDQVYYILDEIYETELITGELIERCDALLGEWNLTKEQVTLYSEREPDRVAEFFAAGWNIQDADKSRGSVRNGIMHVKSCKVVLHPRCVNTQEEAESYSWKTDRAGNTLEEPVKWSDHAMDAIRYAIYTHAFSPDPDVL